MIYVDRPDAGRALAGKLAKYAGRDDVVVLALPRGGVPVAFEGANSLAAPLDIFVVRKMGLPGHEELAIGAVASGGIRVLNRDVISAYGVPRAVIDGVALAELKEVERRERVFREGAPPAEIVGKIAILVDDG